MEYPNYATSYALRVLPHWGAPSDSATIQRMVSCLVGQPYDEDRGIDSEHPAYGAWGFGETSLPLGQAGHIYLSLAAHTALTHIEGIPPNPSQWEHAMFYYHLMVRSEAYAALNYEGTWKDEMIALLAERQRPDGSFSNPLGAPNEEDDPILATAMVVSTLLNTH